MERQQHIKEQDEFLYDSFPIYSNEDGQWVHGTLREELEDNRNFELFIYMRDMLGGGTTGDRILEGMAQCCKFILILSPNFLASNYCLLEAYVAHHKFMERGHDVMVVIKLDALPLAGIPELITNTEHERVSGVDRGSIWLATFWGQTRRWS